MLEFIRDPSWEVEDSLSEENGFPQELK